jgi:hypothetical protein
MVIQKISSHLEIQVVKDSKQISKAVKLEGCSPLISRSTPPIIKTLLSSLVKTIKNYIHVGPCTAKSNKISKVHMIQLPWELSQRSQIFI